DPEAWSLIADDCLAAVMVWKSRAERGLKYLRQHNPDDDLLRLIRHRPAQLVLAADAVAEKLERDVPAEVLRLTLPRDLVSEVALRIARRPAAVGHLSRLVDDPDQRLRHSTSATLLHALGQGWK